MQIIVLSIVLNFAVTFALTFASHLNAHSLSILHWFCSNNASKYPIFSAMYEKCLQKLQILGKEKDSQNL